MIKLLLALAFLGGSVASAAAACTSPATMHDFLGASFLMSMSANADGNCQSNVQAYQGTSPWVNSITVWGGGTLGAASAWGSAPTGNVPGVNGNILASVLPTGGATSALQTTGNTALTTINATLGSPFQAGGSIANTTFASTQSGAWTFNPTTAATWGLGAFGTAMPGNGQGVGLWDGTNMVHAKGDETSGLWVNIKAGAGSGGTAATDNSAFTQGTTNETPMGCYFLNGTYAAITAGHVGVVSCTNVGSLHTTVDNATPGIANNADAIATVAASSTSPVPVNNYAYLFNGTTWDRGRNGRQVSALSAAVVPTPALSTWHLIAANSTNATSVKGSAATLFSCQLANNSTNIAFLKIYNKATAPTVGTDTPVKTLIIPGPAAGGGGSNISFGPGGLTLGTGFAAAVTGVITDADTTAVAATAFAINCDYE